MPCVAYDRDGAAFTFSQDLKIVLAQRIHIIWSLARARKTEYIYIVMKPSIGNPVSWMGPGTFVGIIIFLLKNLVSLNFLFSSGFLIEIYTICIELESSVQQYSLKIPALSLFTFLPETAVYFIWKHTGCFSAVINIFTECLSKFFSFIKALFSGFEAKKQHFFQLL